MFNVHCQLLVRSHSPEGVSLEQKLARGFSTARLSLTTTSTVLRHVPLKLPAKSPLHLEAMPNALLIFVGSQRTAEATKMRKVAACRLELLTFDGAKNEV